jgi:hypothetical protein
MADFTPIETQEQFNEMIHDRIEQAKRSEAKKFEGYISPTDVEALNKQIADLTAAAENNAKKYADYDKTLAERDAQIKKYETASVKSRIAHDMGLPYGMADRLSGEDEEAIKKDAEALKAILGTQPKKTTPLAGTESTGKDDAYKNMLSKLKGE